MKKKLTLAAMMIASVLFVAGQQATAAGTVCPAGPITIEGKKPVNFDHKAHLDLGISCGECHHDAQHQPLSEEAIGGMNDTGGLKCVSCHNDSFANEKFQKAKDIFHGNCKDCHQQGYQGKTGPTKCNECHTVKKKAIEGC